jgi:hypothetical protein
MPSFAQTPPLRRSPNSRRGRNVSPNFCRHQVRSSLAHDSSAVSALPTDADNTRARRFYERLGFSASAMAVYRRFPGSD